MTPPPTYNKKGRRGVIELEQLPKAQSRYLTVAEVAATLRVSNMTVYRLISSHQLAAVRVGRSYRIREEDVDYYLAQRYSEAVG